MITKSKITETLKNLLPMKKIPLFFGIPNKPEH